MNFNSFDPYWLWTFVEHLDNKTSRAPKPLLSTFPSLCQYFADKCSGSSRNSEPINCNRSSQFTNEQNSTIFVSPFLLFSYKGIAWGFRIFGPSKMCFMLLFQFGSAFACHFAPDPQTFIPRDSCEKTLALINDTHFYQMLQTYFFSKTLVAQMAFAINLHATAFKWICQDTSMEIVLQRQSKFKL